MWAAAWAVSACVRTLLWGTHSGSRAAQAVRVWRCLGFCGAASTGCRWGEDDL